MTVTELHDQITAELDRLEAIEGEATDGEWEVDGAPCSMNLIRSTGDGEVVASDLRDSDAALIVEARNRFRPMLAFMRREMDRIKGLGLKWYGNWAPNDPVYIRAKEDLSAIAAALGLEVGNG